MTRMRCLLALTLTLLTTLAAVAVGAAPALADPHYAEPTVGECHDYPAKVVFHHSEGSAPVDCASAHSAVVIAVLDAPKRLNLDSSAAGRYVGSHCGKVWARALGGTKTTRAISALSYDWFAPSKAQQRQGAHWIRCDAILLGGRGKLAPLPASLRLGHPPLDDAVARCLQVVRSSEYVTVCTRRHTFRTMGAFVLKGSHFPSQAALDAAAARRCPAFAGPHYYVGFPSKAGWAAGYRLAYCYDKTPR